MNTSRRTLLKGVGCGSLVLGASPGLWAQSQPVEKQNLRAEKQSVSWFADSDDTRIWGYDQRVIEFTQFQKHVVSFTNQLDEPTSVHWHGMTVANAMDGVSGLTQAPVKPSESFDYELTPKDAGTYWAHAHHETYRQLAMGLYTPVIVHEVNPYPVDQDLLFVADDWLINQQGQIASETFGRTHDWSHGGRMGNMLTVNRVRNPDFSVKAGSRVRLRLLNAANSRIMRFSFPGVPVHVIAKDGQPLAEAVAMNEPLTIAPAERLDLVLDLPADWQGSYPIHELSGREPYLAARWQVAAADNARKTKSPVMALPPNPMPTVSATANVKLTLDMKGGAMGNLRAAYYQGEKLSVNELVEQGQFWTFNGVANLPEEPLVRAKVGDVIEINLSNTTPWPHAMHLHGHHFQANHPQLGQRIWQDTVLVNARSSDTIRFVATEPGKWLLHCHMIEHQISGMVTFLDITT